MSMANPSDGVKGPLTSDQDGSIPLNFGIIVFPGFQALDAFGPLDALNTLAFTLPLNLSIIAATLDPVSTKPPSIPEIKFHQSIVPTHTFTTAPPLDVLIIPGGRGTVDPSIQFAIDFVARVYPSLKYLITVCTGSGIAARAGVLDGRRATTNKLRWASIVELRPQVKWISHARWVVDGNVWTSAGVSAGLDVVFGFIAEVYGEQTAERLANHLEYKRHTDPSWDPFAELHGLTDS
ncbi:Isonitrile hydratase [Hypsizygus marmoreus]|uniref:Isonitrile hydratase n=1 Tax=Hypsizygus marmoreus TaxID=39966 RepID=A0A369JCX6_HYPMA|nr:Isonitrile hydratase [Hypsizygus marmoreus]